MTILGKILIVFNLIFSLVVGAFIVLAFAKQTNWKEAADRWHKSYDVVVADAKTYQNEGQAAKDQAAQEVKKARDEKTQVDIQLQAAQDQLRQVKTQVAEAATQLQLAQTASGGSTTETSKLQEALAKLQKQKDDLQLEIVKVEDRAQEYRNQQVAAEIGYRSEERRSHQLLDQVAQLTQDNEELKTRTAGTGKGGGTAAPSITTAMKPPSEDVDGFVTDSDPKTGLVTLSIGSDAGVSAGNTLEVFRLRPKPEYVGTVRIVDSRPHESVARAVQPLRAGPIRKGDEVASRIAK